MEEEDPVSGACRYQVCFLVEGIVRDKQHLDEGGIPSKPGG